MGFPKPSHISHQQKDHDLTIVSVITSNNLPLSVFNSSGVELPDVVLSLEQTECLLNAFDAPYTIITPNETNHATSTTTDKDASFVPSPYDRGKPSDMVRSHQSAS